MSVCVLETFFCFRFLSSLFAGFFLNSITTSSFFFYIPVAGCPAKYFWSWFFPSPGRALVSIVCVVLIERSTVWLPLSPSLSFSVSTNTEFKLQSRCMVESNAFMYIEVSNNMHGSSILSFLFHQTVYMIMALLGRPLSVSPQRPLRRRTFLHYGPYCVRRFFTMALTDGIRRFFFIVPRVSDVSPLLPWREPYTCHVTMVHFNTFRRVF